MSRRLGQTDDGHRNGITLVAVLVCLLVIMLFSSAIVKALVNQRRGGVLQERKMQCFCLAESALQRAKSQLRFDSKYTGETWKVSLIERGVEKNGVAEIRIEPVANESQLVHVRVEARWPDDPVFRVQHIKEVNLRLSTFGASP